MQWQHDSGLALLRFRSLVRPRSSSEQAVGQSQACPVRARQPQRRQPQLPQPRLGRLPRGGLPADGLSEAGAAPPSLVHQLGIPQKQTPGRNWYSPCLRLPTSSQPHGFLAVRQAVEHGEMSASFSSSLHLVVRHHGLPDGAMAPWPHDRGAGVLTSAWPYVHDALEALPIAHSPAFAVLKSLVVPILVDVREDAVGHLLLVGGRREEAVVAT
mmetsp:Transcript_88636/g.225671  ORF Transcript_88636/g.225671 Transcript_88636/m.225671 type:complete len:213 (+) Transcript_88636:249-887(+)